MNLVILNGHLGGDPEMKSTKSGKLVCRFSLATNENWGGEKKTAWHNVVCWNKTAELAEKYLEKGSCVGIQGRIEYSQWEDDDGQKRYKTEIIADRLEFMGRTERAEGPEPKGGSKGDRSKR